MLSISPVANSAKAGHYFDSDNYYAKDDPEAKELSGWWGKTAEALGLSGQIDREQFVQLLNGKMPNGEQLGIVKNGEYHHRHGYDLTFSAPKSVSLMLELAGDKRLLTAHDKAVNAVLTQIEAELASARITHKGETRIEQTGNLAIAKFVHDTSRALDPQLHTHAVILNATIREDGKIRALASQSHGQTAMQGKMGFMERLYENKLYYGGLYRAHLAYEVSELGYTVEKTHRDGRFDIAGVPHEVIKHFSKRREDIEQAMKAHGLEGAKQAAYATLLTRANKQDIAHDELRLHWQKETKSIGFDASVLFEKALDKVDKTNAFQEESVAKTSTQTQSGLTESSSKELLSSASERAISLNFFDTLVEQLKSSFKSLLKGSTKETFDTKAMMSKEDKAIDAVSYAIAHLSERNASFTLKEIKHIAFTHSLGTISPNHVDTAIDFAFSNALLLKGQHIQSGEALLTTQVAIDLEQDTLNRMNAGKDQLTPLISSVKAQTGLREYGLNAEQYQAALMILTSKDRVVGIQGYAGTGKTSSLQATRKVAEAEIKGCLSAIKHISAEYDLQIKGIAPSAAAANQLAESAGIPSQTVTRFLIEQQDAVIDTKDKTPRLWILDEASMVSSRQMNELIKQAEKQGAHLVAVGDIMQLLAVEAGKIFAQMQQAGMQTCLLTEIKRQTNQILRASVYDSIRHDIDGALTKIGGDLIELPNENERLNALADAWLSLKPDDRAKTLVITPANQDREVVNQLIRDGLIKEGVVDGFGRKAFILKNENLTLIEKTRAANYQEGMIIRFGQANPHQKIKANSYWEVTAVYKELDKLHLSNGKNRSLIWDPNSTKKMQGVVELYSLKNRELAKGDTLRWTRNDKKRGMTNAELATVLKVKNEKATMSLSNGKTLILDLSKKENQHWEYAYASTVYAAQGQTNTNVIAHDVSYSRLTTQRAFYVILSRAREKVQLFVDDRKAYLKQLQSVSGDKISALEVLLKPEALPSLNEFKPKLNTSLPIDSIKPDSSFKTEKQTDKLYFDKEKIREGLHHQLEHIVERLLGQPNQKLSKTNEWRYGKKGSLVITMSGNNQGKWHSFEGGKGKVGGDIFSLIEREMLVDFNKAILIAASWVGIAPSQKNVPITSDKAPALSLIDKNTRTQEDLKQIARATNLYAKSKPLAGTLAEKYLQDHRGIGLKSLPDSLRFLPANHGASPPALIIKAENKEGKLEAVQLIYLDNNTGEKAKVDVQKRQFGRMRFGAYGIVQEGSNHKVMIAEGVETALSIAEANPAVKVITTLSGGNIKNVELPEETKQIILCADNDKGREEAINSLMPAIKRFQMQGKEVYLAFPELPQKESSDKAISSPEEKGKAAKIDFNDVHKLAGIELVKQQTQAPERMPDASKSLVELVQQSQSKPIEKNIALEQFTDSKKSNAQIDYSI